MLHEEIGISSIKYDIRASVKIPSDDSSSIGVILSHGGVINRHSLVRKGYSFGEYLCEELGAYVIAPDFLGETLHKQEINFKNFSEILNITTKYFVEKYGLSTIMGFGHSIGSLVLIQSLRENDYIESIVNYGSPIKELSGKRQTRFIEYLINYISTYDYSINIRHLLEYIFDKETCIYLENVMLVDEKYNAENYNFDFESNMIKDMLTSIDASINLIKEWNKPALFIFGSKDGVTKKSKKYYKHGDVDKKILFHHIPNVPRIMLAEIYRWADVFVFPTLIEGMGLVVLEAMASGIPVIVTPNGPGDVVREGVDGYVVPIRDVDAIADRLDYLRANPEARMQMGANARERALEFTWEAYGRNVLRELEIF